MTNVTYEWKCEQCLKCCTQTVNDTPFGKCGVYLLPEERKLFPDIIVKPMYGVGVKGKTRPRPAVIYAYQMIASPCPNLDKEERTCKIYPYRPLVCRQFPISATMGGVVLHRECPALSKLIPKNAIVTPQQLKGLDNEIKAMRGMETYFKLIFIFNVYRVNLEWFWFYDFENRRWVVPSEKQLYEALGEMRKRHRRYDK